MQTTSATWASLFAAGNCLLQPKAVINGTTYTDITPPVIKRALMQDGLSIGNVCAACCEFSVRTSNSIPKAAKVQLYMRLTDGTTSSEWLPAGEYYISRRATDPVTGIVTIQCFDALLKAGDEAPLMPWTDGSGNVMQDGNGNDIMFTASYPRYMSSLLDDILYLLGVELDSRTTLATGSIYMVTPDEHATINDLLGMIAAANGGNWIMTPEGKLRLVPIISAADATSADTAVEVSGITGEISVGETGTISGIRYVNDSGELVLVGGDTGIVLDANVSGAIAQALVTALSGMTFQPYILRGAIYDPAAELGDYVRAGANSDVASVLYSETITLGPAIRGEISAPSSPETEDEYPYLGGASRRAYNAAITYAQRMTQRLDDSLDQESIFNRLTDNGETQGLILYDGKVYLNASYIRAGTIIADLIKGGVLTLGGNNNSSGVLRVVNDNDEEIVLLNDSGANISEGSIVSYSADKQDRMMLNTGVLSFQGFLPSASSTVEEWRPYLNIRVNNTGSTIEDSVTQFFSAGAISITPGDLQYVQIIAATTNPADFNILLVDHNGIHITGSLLISNGTNSGTGASGTFTTANGKTVTVINGIITSIV